MVEIVRKIDKLRIDKGWSIYKLADEADISQQTYHQWLNGDTTPSIPALNNVCCALGVTMAEIFAKNKLVEVSDEVLEMYNYWKCLNEDEKASIIQIVKNFIKNK